ncbi:hypothetical protein ACFQ6C_26510 [Streptomyces sp. NPDC056454]|uniref:hypothetical protein n=1 Tax=Streptomyces sp. NPDC056454 TaxID=3345823 RepID=UPI003688AFF9
MIENTTRSVRENPLAFLAASSGPGGSGQAIEEQERAGQAQLVNSDRLPTDRQGSAAEYEALGFTFGDPDPGDPLFAPATLPEGWTCQASDHDMWSHLVDEHGRRRASIFYKAAHYDRRAFMDLTTVAGYLYAHIHNGAELVTDESWATPAAIAEACAVGVAAAQEKVDRWEARGHDGYVAEYTAERERYAAILAKYAAG